MLAMNSGKNIESSPYTKEKNLRCKHPGCIFATAWRASLSQHKKIHCDKKDHPCDYPGCRYAARQKSNLKRHKKRHETEILFVCRHHDCAFSTPWEEILEQHELTKHTSPPTLPPDMHYQSEDLLKEAELYGYDNLTSTQLPDM